MTDAPDDRLTVLLQESAPPARDPLFRLQVIERRERARFRRRAAALLAAAFALALVAGVMVPAAGLPVAWGAGLLLPAGALALAMTPAGPAARALLRAWILGARAA